MQHLANIFPRVLLTALCASLAACGGGHDTDTTTGPTASPQTLGTITVSKSAAYIPQSRGTATAPLEPSTNSTGALTSVQLISTATTTQSNVVTTFGQAFGVGDVPKGETLVGKIGGNVIPLQVDAKAYHADGSLRHAVITVKLPSSAPKQTQTVTLHRSSTAVPTSQTSPAALLNSGFTANFTAKIGGVQYSASADSILKSGKYATWLSGQLVNEWMVVAPLKTASGAVHPHLVARFAIRSYTGINATRVDVTVENSWAFEAGPRNFTYDAQVLVGGQPVYTQSALTHYHHARWRKVFWWGIEPALDVRHDPAYLISTKAVPNYDRSLSIKETTFASWNTRWMASATGPMKTGVSMASMPTTGARPDIGPMPTWNALYVLTSDPRMKKIAVGMSDLAGTWSAHYRNKNTDRPVTLAEYPYMTIVGRASDTMNKTTKRQEAFPLCPTDLCEIPTKADVSHQPAFSYVPYLMTGDYYHLEELQFYANFNSFYGNPAYREYAKGLVKGDQVRGQAWGLRTLAEAAYITPDNDPQKAVLTKLINDNIDWYNTTYTNNPSANQLGILSHGSFSYNEGTGMAPWQDDFFTGIVGRVAELGFTRAQPLLAWKSKFVVDRMVGDGFCWIQASLYSAKVKSSESAPLYTTIRQVYQANYPALINVACGSASMSSALGLRVDQMVGDFGAGGQQTVMQPALAYSAALSADAKKAWSRYYNRAYKPDLSAEPQYAIVPR